MSYQVLARKWRPRSFTDMVGQAHVVRALGNALDRGQVHHAYLFTGTRGVGKTTLARILSKALNCEQGVSSRPCGQCTSCREIDEGRFVDLLEVDAASRTKVDQTRDLLDNVPFAPVKGRFKVYLIDEVHMFSGHSFNALLKTLEEPPPHVKFLLATTDPQKVPVTVLSRCLQLNLKRLLPEEIQRQLAHILTTEGIAYDDQALALLARAADGSMRDGLSLLDQAIAFGGGRVQAEEVRAMLGTVSRDLVLNLLQALADGDGAALLTEVGRIAELTPDFGGVLQDLLVLLHRIALVQQIPATLAADDPERERLAALAATVAPEDVQLYYQIGLLGQQDLTLAPDPRTGIEMVLLRMLAFRPEGAEDQPEAARAARPTGAATSPAAAPEGATASPASAKPSPAAAALAAARQATAAPPTRSPQPRTRARDSDVPAPAPETPDPQSVIRNPRSEIPDPQSAIPNPQSDVPRADLAVAEPPPPALKDAEDWHRLVAKLRLGGVASQLAGNCQFSGWDGRRLSLTLDPESQHMWVTSAEERLRGALAEVLGAGLRLEIRIARPHQETPAQRRIRLNAERLAGAEALMAEDPVARALEDRLDARWIAGSIEPAD
jgi:DNA polymerase-3 subunit gamma/tau